MNNNNNSSGNGSGGPTAIKIFNNTQTPLI